MAPRKRHGGIVSEVSARGRAGVRSGPPCSVSGVGKISLAHRGKSARGRCGGLAGDLSAEAADQSCWLTLHPFMAPAGGLAVLSNFLGVSAVQVHQAVGHKDGGETDQEREQADVYPRESHGVTSGAVFARELGVRGLDAIRRRAISMPSAASYLGLPTAFNDPPNALKSRGRILGVDSSPGVPPSRCRPVSVAQWARLGIFETGRLRILHPVRAHLSIHVGACSVLRMSSNDVRFWQKPGEI